jgi:protein involved in ribonucleotide reduction|nr:MAG TPA: Sulfite reductase [Caudoviricetes sp.]
MPNNQPEPWMNHLLVAYSLSGNTQKVFDKLKETLWLRNPKAAPKFEGICLTNALKEGVRGHLKAVDRIKLEIVQQYASLDMDAAQFRGKRMYSSVVWLVPSYGRFVDDPAIGRRVKDDMIPQPLKEFLQAEKLILRDTPQFIIGVGNLTFGRDFCAAVKDTQKILEAQGYTDITHVANVDICASEAEVEDMATTISDRTEKFLTMLESKQSA